MRPLEVSDHVVLKQDLSLYGFVQRTNNDSYDPIEDDLIIAHAEVPPDILNDFLISGVPPTGYVFVQFANPAAGSSLLHQDDLVLLSRSYRLGDCVRRDGSPLTGAVIDVQESYILAPVFANITANALPLPPYPKCTPECPSNFPPYFSHPNPHTLLYDIPAREIQRAQDVARDDYIISRSWVGLVDEVEYAVVILLQDGAIVAITGPYGLHIPVPDYGKPLVALPEPDGFKRPDILGATQEWARLLPIAQARPGEFVIIDRHQLRNGRWISGSYDPTVPAQGVVLDSRACDVSVDWVSSSNVWDDRPVSERLPKDDIQVYENIRTFRDTASLRQKKDITVYDPGKMPVRNKSTAQQQGGRREDNSTHKEVSAAHDVYSGQELGIGMRVKFRDTPAAAVKYQAINGVSHGKFIRIPTHLSHGWDINEFEIVYIQQHATVLWQDGTTTTTNSTSLTGFALFEAEMAPTDIVLKREGMRQRPVNHKGKANGGTRDFNEMIFFERPHDLLPTSVGVVQSVDPTERVARVRWYKEPRVELRASGQVLSTDSRFGPIGDVIEDVSLYEIMSFPSLLRQRSDMCVISSPGEAKAERNKRQITATEASENPVDEAADQLETSESTSRQRQRARPPSMTPRSTSRDGSWKEVDWVGQIVAINLDGSITVRLGALQQCRDVSVDADSILATIDDRGHLEEMPGSMMDLDSWMDSLSEWSEQSPEPISETVEYEGGQRLDNDSGDENWVSDQDEIFEDAEEELPDTDGDVEMSEDKPKQSGTPSTKPERSLLQLQTMLGSEPPPQFLVLDCEPPTDQFGLHSAPTAQTSLKRIAKEHKILATSLPENEIYVRTYEARLDLLRCLIIGPKDTPYENAPFLIDLYLPERFPDEPPNAHFHSWTSGLGRINPNLYEEGKICLSLLGTWSGKNESEKWSDKATILQLLVSLQGLVFVKKPFYNEAGFEGYENDRAYTRESEQYSEKAFVMARGFVKYALLRPTGGMEDVLAWLYLSHDPSRPSRSLLGTIIERGKLLLEKSEQARSVQDDSLLDAAGEKGDATKVFLKPLSRGASVMLRRSIGELQAQLDQLASGDARQRGEAGA
ncbi:ubiquitin conjugating enzyme [Cladophialophora carrionii]|uniref:Ubiquitin conjugating enzyme n=1 Tax=Cladophialophora carrionii TaxID=86049 RepID=A0A1C1CFV4_9EURO|nr:ubiquitin conjugating enzyme [Cladophialophora carrionii]